MTVSDLIAELQCENPDSEVQIMHQQSWPLVEVIAGTVTQERIEYMRSLEEGGEERLTTGTPDGPTTVYLIADGHPRGSSPYGDKLAWSEF